MTFIQILTMVVFVLAGALMGYKAWRTDGPVPQPATAVEIPSDEADMSVVPPVVDKAPE